jgi:hypothetical protein
MSYQQLWSLAPQSEAQFINFGKAFLEHKDSSEEFFLDRYNAVSKSGHCIPYRPYYQCETVAWLYHLALSYGLFQSVSEAGFVSLFLPASHHYPRRYRRNGWYEAHGTDFRQKLKFQNHGCEKKSLSEKEKWRRECGLYRDKARSGQHSSNHKKFGKKEFNDKHRARERRLIETGRYDELTAKLNKPWLD